MTCAYNRKLHGFRNAEAGFSMLFIVGALLAMSTLAAGILSLTTSSVYTEFNAMSYAQARLVSLSGYNYVLQFKEDYDELEGMTISLGNDSEFTIGDNMRQRQDANGNLWMDVEIIGTVHKGTANEANYVLDRSFQPEDQGAITFADNWEDFDEVTPDDGLGKNPITKNEDKTFTIGNSETYAFGAFYYMGTKTLNWGANECVLGECQFKYGFRLFFVSHYDSSAADGIVFAWYNAQLDGTGTEQSMHGKDCKDYAGYSSDDTYPDYTYCKDQIADANNIIYGSRYEACKSGDNSNCDLYASIGGDSQHGEMIGYAGDGRYYKSYNNRTLYGWLDPERNGIQEPKMGIEFDNFWNSSTNICNSGIEANPVSGSRHDPGSSSSPSHLAFVFWGKDVSASQSEDDLDTIPYPCALYNGYTTKYDCKDVCVKEKTYCNGNYVWVCDGEKYSKCKPGFPGGGNNNCGEKHNGWYCTGSWSKECDGEEVTKCIKWEKQCGETTSYDYYTVDSPSYGLSGGTSNIEGSNTYDDNRHWYGDNDTLTQNLDTGNGTSWAGKTFAFRAEVERHYRYTNDNGKYDYTITSWLKNCSTNDCAEYWDDSYYTADNGSDTYYDDLYFSDTSRFLCWDTTNDTKCSYSNTPTLQKTIELTATQNEMFDTMLFGFTEATGGSTQKATYSQFILQFIKENDYNYADDKLTIESHRRVHDRQID